MLIVEQKDKVRWKRMIFDKLLDVIYPAYSQNNFFSQLRRHLHARLKMNMCN